MIFLTTFSLQYFHIIFIKNIFIEGSREEIKWERRPQNLLFCKIQNLINIVFSEKNFLKTSYDNPKKSLRIWSQSLKKNWENNHFMEKKAYLEFHQVCS